jgi:chemotaxis protein MotA
MDILTLIGIVVSIGAILGGNALEGGHIGSLLQLTAFIIVMGGTVGAVLVQTQMAVFLHALKLAVWVFKPPPLEIKAALDKILQWSQVARKEGLLGLQDAAENEPDDFSKKALQLLVDGREPEAIRRVLEVDLSSQETHDTHAAKVFDGLGGYSPTIGIIGAVMGLIHVMNNLADPSALGPGIAVAFVATIYGVSFANLFFLPMGNKLKTIIGQQSHFRDMVIDGIVSIAEGENPRNIETKLQGYLK